jgi:hypothetical protein
MHSTIYPTQHAIMRMSQRGISFDDIRMIVSKGRGEDAPGNAERYLIKEKERIALIEYHRKEMKILEKSGGKTIVVAADGGVITAYRKRK